MSVRSTLSTKISQPLSLKRNVSWGLVGNLVYAACQWGMLMVLAKLGTPEIVGLFVLGISVTAPIFTAASLRLRTMLATDSENDFHFADYLALRITACLLSLIITFFVCICVGLDSNTFLAVMGIAIAKSVEWVTDLFLGLQEKQKRMDRVATTLLLQGLLTLIGIGMGLLMSGHILGGIAGFALARVFVLVLKVVPEAILHNSSEKHAPHLLPTWQLSRLASLCWLGFPLAGAALIFMLNANMPRYFLAHYIGLKELGIFGAIATLLTAGETAVRALSQAACPMLAQHYRNGNVTAFRRLFLQMIGITCLIGFAGVVTTYLLGAWLLAVLFQPQYAEQARALLLVMCGAAVFYAGGVVDSTLIAVRQMRAFLPMRLLTTITTVTSCGLLIPEYGLNGAAFSLAITNIPSVLVGLYYIWQAIPDEIQAPERRLQANPIQYGGG